MPKGDPKGGKSLKGNNPPPKVLRVKEITPTKAKSVATVIS